MQKRGEEERQSAVLKSQEATVIVLVEVHLHILSPTQRAEVKAGGTTFNCGSSVLPQLPLKH